MRYDSYDTEERFNFKTGEWEDANGKKLILQGEKYKKKADMILKKIEDAIKKKEYDLDKLVYQNRG